MIEIVQIAKIVHQANKAYCEALRDYSQKNWEDAPENIRNSAIDGVRFKLENPNVTPEDSHNNWLKFKEADGWKYGETKDEKLKTHPCFVPYNELSREQQIKDYLFNNIVKTFSE